MKNHASLARRAVPILLLAPCFAGCFELKQGPSKTVDTIVKTEPKVVGRQRFMADLKLEGTKLSISARPTCALVEMAEVKHTTKTPNRLEAGAVGGLVALAVAGSVPLVGGVVMLADSPKVFASKRDSRTYNGTGKGAAIGLGGLLTAIGGIAVTIPIVNAGRAASVDSTSSTEERESKTLRNNVACDGSVAAIAVNITAQSPGVSAQSLGNTDAQGNLTTDLKVALASWYGGNGPPPVSAEIYANNQLIGELRTESVARALFQDHLDQGELLWSQAEPDACKSQRTEVTCARVRAYLTTFPTGRHIGEANELLGAMAPQQPVVAINREAELLSRAEAAAREAQNLAANKVRQHAEKDQKKALLKSEEEASRAGQSACIATCKKVCQESLGASRKGVPNTSQTCDATCREEACP